MAELLEVASLDDVERWKLFLALVDYKPGWSFSVVEEHLIPQGVIAVRFRMLVHDTIRARDLCPVVVITDFSVPADLLGSKFSYSGACDFLRDRIHLIEAHEADEWFRFDGMQCFNPHGESQALGRRPEGWEWFGPPELMISPSLKEKTGV